MYIYIYIIDYISTEINYTMLYMYIHICKLSRQAIAAEDHLPWTNHCGGRRRESGQSPALAIYLRAAAPAADPGRMINE
jgi:hypothetical protein